MLQGDWDCQYDILNSYFSITETNIQSSAFSVLGKDQRNSSRLVNCFSIFSTGLENLQTHHAPLFQRSNSGGLLSALTPRTPLLYETLFHSVVLPFTLL
jgi:hypothetical protein